ncbi:MAG: PHB depolymerase family esterase [Acidimicrobiia bacterium]|nr:PHB depolymerase family esterase [Acidimicrobiia bacterium]
MTTRHRASAVATIICLTLTATACASPSDERSAVTAGSSAPGEPDTGADDRSDDDLDDTTSSKPTIATSTVAAGKPTPTTADTDPPATEATLESERNPVACASVEPGQQSFTLDAGGAIHDVQAFVPRSFDGTEALPLVLNWHGLGSNGGQQAVFTGYEELAEAKGFIVAHPTGVPFGVGGPNSWELGRFDDPGRDDVVFADALIDHMVAQYCVDESRVYSTGMSNGGLFTSFLVCGLAHRLAAAASVAGVTHHDGCNPSRAVPFIALHGTADAVVPFDGSASASTLEGSGTPSVFFDQVMPDEFAEFAVDMGCHPDPEVDAYSADVIAHSYVGCDDDVPLVFYEIADGGHTWPNTPVIDLLPEAFGYTTREIDATVDSWAFFEQHQLRSS